MPPSPTETGINAYLLAKLRAADCVQGKLDVDVATQKTSLTGQRRGGQPVFWWEFDRPFGRLLADYLEARTTPDTAQLSITVDVAAGTCRYASVSKTALRAAADRDKQQQLAAHRARPRDAAPYGAALAEQVASALRQGRCLGYGHRDYCGMGLDYADGRYRYGAIWDGYLEPTRTFDTRAAFVAWLAGQSDAALARLEEADSWLWDNQTVTRQRLAELVQGLASL